MSSPAGSSQTQRLAYSVREAAESLGVSARTIVREIQRGRIRAIRIGRRVVVPAQSLAEFLNCEHNRGSRMWRGKGRISGVMKRCSRSSEAPLLGS
jgi:excisionase family DNA binding protein